MTVKGILLVPTDNALLAEGECGSRPPRVYQSTAKATLGRWRPLVSSANMSDKKRALALAWKGVAHRAGIFYANGEILYIDSGLAPWVQSILEGRMDHAGWHSFYKLFNHLGTFVFTDEGGREVTI